MFVSIQHAMRMRLLSSVACPALQYFFFFQIISHKAGFKKILNIKCVFRFSLQLLLETFFILRRTERDMIKNVNFSSCKVYFILVEFSWNLHFLGSFSKNTQITNFIKIRPVRDQLFHADRRTNGQT